MTRTKFNIMQDSGIYQIQSRVGGKIYIGSSQNIRGRIIKGHLKDLLNNKHCNVFLQRHYNKYGKGDLIFKVIELCSKEKLIEREQYYIDTLKPEFNICKKAASRLGTKFTNKSKKKLSASLKGRIPWNKGKINCYSEETRKKISDSLTGRFRGKDSPSYGIKRLEETKRKISENNGGRGRIPWNKGLTKEIDERVESGKKGKLLTEEIKEKIRNTLIGRKHTKEAKQNMSIGQKTKAWANNEERRQKLRDFRLGKPSGMKGNHHSEETRKSMSEIRMGREPTKGFSGKYHSEEAKKQMSVSHKINRKKRAVEYA